MNEPNIVDVPAPVTISSGFYGQFYDLLEMFKIGGQLPDTNYLFLGNYVSHGFECVETITLLILLKVRYPKRITLLRGKQESLPLTQRYGFYDECLRKYANITIY